MAIVLCGPSGCGKTHVGQALARLRGVAFVDADVLQPPENRAKMIRGEPLDDADRAPWLDAVAAALSGDDTIVLACSALRRTYRDRLRRADPDLIAILLDINPATARDRLTRRIGHFIPVSLIDSQFATLEPLEADECGITITSTGGVEQTATLIQRTLKNLESKPI